MGFLDIGLGEILLILVVALIIFGPGRIPEIARTMGRVARNLKRVTSDLTTTITKELDVEEKNRSLQSGTSSDGNDKKSPDGVKTELQPRND